MRLKTDGSGAKLSTRTIIWICLTLAWLGLAQINTNGYLIAGICGIAAVMSYILDKTIKE